MCALITSMKKSFSNNNNNCMEIHCLFALYKYKKSFRFVKCVLITFHLLGFFYSFKGKGLIYHSLPQLNNGVVKFVNCLSDLLLALFGILILSFPSPISLFMELTEYAKKKNLLVRKNCKLFSSLVWCFRLLVFVPIIINVYFIGFLIGWDMYQYYMDRDMLYWGHNLIVVVYILLAMRIKNCFFEIGHRLKQFNRYFIDNKVFVIFADKATRHPIKNEEYLSNLKMITEMHNSLCDFVEKINRGVKPILATMMLCIVGNIFYDCTVLIEFGVKPKVIRGVETKPYIFIIHFLFISISVAQAAGAAFVGEALEQEGQDITGICYSMLNKLTVSSKTDIDGLIEKQLQLLLDQSKSRKVRLKAGGFFDVNWSILGSIASTVATYSIVIIQFLLK